MKTSKTVVKSRAILCGRKKVGSNRMSSSSSSTVIGTNPVVATSSSIVSAAAPANDSKMMWAAKLYGSVDGNMRDFTKEELQKKLKLELVPLPVPQPGEVLIKVALSSILPMNMSELKATYGTWNKDPSNAAGVLMGSEGCGTVIASGGGLMAWRMVGKRVAFFRYNSAWAEYACVKFTQTMDIGELPFDKAASAFANPFTALAFIEIAKAAGCRTIVHTAAASALGLMLIRHAKRCGVNVIAVVRRAEQAQACLKEGALLALDTTAADFVAELAKACTKHQATIAFDAVAGSLTGDVMCALPAGGKVYVYGGLSEQRPVVSTRDLIFKRKSLDGFWLKDYVSSKYSLSLLQWQYTVVSYLDTDFASATNGVVPLSKIHDAVVAYAHNMSNAKVLIACDESSIPK